VSLCNRLGLLGKSCLLPEEALQVFDGYPVLRAVYGDNDLVFVVGDLALGLIFALFFAIVLTAFVFLLVVLFLDLFGLSFGAPWEVCRRWPLWSSSVSGGLQRRCRCQLLARH
jgi:hypothetical protein